MIVTVPPFGHFADARVMLREDGGYALVVGTAEFGNGTSTVHRQIAATVLGAAIDAIQVLQSDKDNGGHDTGAYGSAGTVVAGRASQLACEALREQILDFAAEHAGGARAAWSLVDGAVSLPGKRVGLAELATAACAKGRRLTAMGRSDGSPRSVAFNVRRFASPSTNTPARSKSCAASTQRMPVVSSIRCSAAGRSKAAWRSRSARPSTRKWSSTATGRVLNPTFRNYHLPQFGDVPRTEVLFADTSDTIGPFGAKSMSESPYNPVAAAMGNAIADATGIRFCQTPFKPDRIYAAIVEKFGAAD